MDNFQGRGVWIWNRTRSWKNHGSGSDLSWDRLDPVSPERFDTDPVNIRPDPKPCWRTRIFGCRAFLFNLPSPVNRTCSMFRIHSRSFLKLHIHTNIYVYLWRTQIYNIYLLLYVKTCPLKKCSKKIAWSQYCHVFFLLFPQSPQ